nr:MAG TPA_asm: IrrE protein [Caudoviricetes sp.]
MEYEALLKEYDATELIIKEKDLQGSNGRIRGNRIAIKKDISLRQKACVLAEELGHYHTTVGDILDQTDVSNRKQERTARLWAYNKQIGLSGLIHCFEARCQNIHEMADHLDVTEAFLQDALECYRQKYGICTSYQQYTIYFEPKLAICKKLA